MATGKVSHADTTKRDWCLLALAFLIISASTLVWLSMNQAPLSWDPADHIRFGYEYYKPLAGFHGGRFVREFFLNTHYYPPFYHLLIAGIFLVTGPGILSAIVVNLLLLGALMAALYSMGRRLYSAEAGLLAAIIAPTYHINAALLHETFVDFALMCWVGLSLYLLVESRYFSRRGPSLLLGAALGLGMLCKQPYVFFLGLPVAYTLIAMICERQKGDLKNAALALSIAALLVLIWYAPHLDDIREIYHINQMGALREHEPPLFSYYSNLGYINGLASHQMQFPLFVLFFIGLSLSAIWYRRESMPLYLTILGGLTAFTFIANKDLRYTVPCLSAVAMLSTCWIGRLPAKWLRATFAALILALGAASFTHAQWPAEIRDIYFDYGDFRWVVFGKNYLDYDRRPSADDWSFPAILKIIGEQSGGRRGTVKVGMVPNLLHFNPSAFALYSQVTWNSRGAHPYIRTKWLVNMESWRQVKRCRYIIVREPIEPDSSGDGFESRFTEWIRSHPERFTRVGATPLTSLNASAVIYEQIDLTTKTQRHKASL
jgi:hypothetical protein